MRTATTILLLSTALALPAAARADTHRLAVVVGHNVGGSADRPLRYAEEDAVKVADVLAQLGDVPQDALFLLRGQGRGELADVLRRVTQRVAELRADPTGRTVLLFYFSGHSDGGALELGGSRVPFDELRRWLADTRADVRVTIVDGCRSGAMARKGGKPAPGFEIRLLDQLDASGEALLTSSAADELALESREIRGSFFTHHLVSGLRGAADASGDGRITLSEAYQYAFDHTIAATAATGVRQHPGYDYRISGQGELVLTEISQPSASLELPAGFERALVLLVRRDQVLAELSGGGPRRLALAPGEYAVRLWKGAQAWAARVTVAAGESRALAWGELSPVASPQVAGKGPAGDDPALDGLSPEAQAEYLKKYFTVGEELVLQEWGTDGAHHASLETAQVIFRGRYREKVDEADFFREIGRADLAERRAEKLRTKGFLIGAGLAVVLGSVAYGVVSMNRADDCDVPLGDPGWADACVDRPGDALKRAVVVGMAGITAGSALILGGAMVDGHPVEPHELRRLADQYNAGLRSRLSSPPPPRPAKDPGLVTLHVAPGAGPTLRGITVGVTF